jgi:molybdate transport system substrate-binding protein
VNARKWMRAVWGAAMAATISTGAAEAELTVLSAGAVEPGLRMAIAAYEKETGHKVQVTFNTAPEIRGRIEGGEKADVVVVPPTLMDEFGRAGKVPAERVMLGRVGQGIAVRPDAPVPDISSVEAMKRALVEADSVVFNRATGGQYIESMLRDVGVYDRIERKTTRYTSAQQVMDHLLKGQGNEIGFAPITEIMLYKDKGLRFVGPLPAEVQRLNAYVASPMSTGANADLAATFVRFLGGPAAKTAFRAAGIE